MNEIKCASGDHSNCETYYLLEICGCMEIDVVGEYCTPDAPKDTLDVYSEEGETHGTYMVVKKIKGYRLTNDCKTLEDNSIDLLDFNE